MIRFSYRLILGLVAVLALAMCTPKMKDKTSSSEASAKENFRSSAPAPGPAPTIELGDYKQFALDNGLQVIVVENHKLPRVSFQLFVDAPEIYEGELAGFVGIAGQLLNKGTETRTKAEIDETVDFMGASLGTSGNGIFGSALTKHTDGLLEVMADVLLHPSFPEDEFEKIQTQTKSAIVSNQDDPNAIASNVGDVLRYGKDHPYGVVSTEETIEKINLNACKAYYETYFKPNISYLVVVGDITPEKAKTAADKYFGDWKQGRAPKTSYDTPQKPGEAKVSFVDKAGAVQSVINITYPIELEPGDPDVIKAYVTNVALGGYFRSRLNNNLREDKGYTYGARSSLGYDRLIGSFNASAQVRNAVTDSSIVEFLYEMERMGTEKMDSSELQLVKNYIMGSFARQLESPQTIARYALNTVRYDLPEDYYKTWLEKVEAVTAEDIMETAQKYVTPDNAYILVVGNKGEVADKLVQFDANGEIDFYDTNGDPVTDIDMPENITAADVIEDYINAIGGENKLSSVKSMEMVMSSESQMGSLEVTVALEDPGKFYTSVAMNGTVMQEQVINGDKGVATQMGNKTPLKEEDLADMKEQAVAFPELNYTSEGYKLSLDGVEKVNGQNAFRIVVTRPSGNKTTEYYAMETSLKIREVSTQEAGPQTMTITRDLTNYKEVDGIKIPHTTTMTGAMPVPMELNVKTVEFNKEFDADTFKVE